MSWSKLQGRTIDEIRESVAMLRQGIIDESQDPKTILEIKEAVIPDMDYKIFYQHYFQMYKLGYFNIVGKESGRGNRKIIKATTDIYIHNGIHVDKNNEYDNSHSQPINHLGARVIKARHIQSINRRHDVYIGCSFNLIGW